MSTPYTTIAGTSFPQDWPEDYGSSGTLAIFATSNFTADDGASFIAGTGESLRGEFVTESAITVAGSTGTYASYLLPTTDTCTPNTIRYFGVIFDSRGSRRDDYFSNRHLRTSLGNSISELQWALDNQQHITPQPDGAPSTSAMNAAISAALLNAALNQDYIIGSYASFAIAVAAMPVTGATLVINQATSVPSNVSGPSYVTLKFTGKGYLNFTTGATLTHAGPIEASPTKIFYNALSGQGTVVLTGDVYPDWWATNTQGTTDMAGAINAADASVCSGVVPNTDPYAGSTIAAQGRVNFTGAIYRVNSTLTYRGAPWIGQGVNNTYIARYGSSGATVNAVGTTDARKELNISGIAFDATHATGTVYGFRLGFNIRSSGAMRQVRIAHFPSYGIFFADGSSDDISFYDVQIINCGNAAGFSGIKVDVTVTDANDIKWYNLSLENNGKAGSGFGGGIDTTGAGVAKQWAFFGGLIQSNLGAGEVLFFGGSNINFYATHIESEGTSDVLTALRFNTVLGVGIHDVFLTGSANTGSALKFTGGTTGVIDNIRAFDNWTTAITLEDVGTRVQVTSLGALVPGTSVVSVASGALLSWPAKNSLGTYITTQATPSTPSVAATLTASDLFIGILTATPNATGATHAYTLPTGTNMESAASFINNDSFDWSISNLAAAALDTITITANTDHTIVGNPIVQSANAGTGGIYGNAALFRSRRVSATVWVTYRLT